MNLFNSERLDAFNLWARNKTLNCPKCRQPFLIPSANEILMHDENEDFSIVDDIVHSPEDTYLNSTLILVCPNSKCAHVSNITSYELIALFFGDYILQHLRDGRRYHLELIDGSVLEIDPYLVLTRKDDNSFVLQGEMEGIIRRIPLSEIIGVQLSNVPYDYVNANFLFPDNEFYLNYCAH